MAEIDDATEDGVIDVSDAMALSDLLELKQELITYRELMGVLRRRFVDPGTCTLLVTFGLLAGLFLLLVPMSMAVVLNWGWYWLYFGYSLLLILFVVFPLFVGVMLRLPKELEEFPY